MLSGLRKLFNRRVRNSKHDSSGPSIDFLWVSTDDCFAHKPEPKPAKPLVKNLSLSKRRRICKPHCLLYFALITVRKHNLSSLALALSVNENSKSFTNFSIELFRADERRNKNVFKDVFGSKLKSLWTAFCLPLHFLNARKLNGFEV